MAYIAPIHRPSSVRHALKLRFLESTEEALVVAKSNCLEVYAQVNDGLTLVYSKSIYGYITMLEKLRPSTSATEHLFIGTDRFQYFTVSWDPIGRKVRTEQSYFDQAEKTLRDTGESDRCHIDPSGRYMTLELFNGVVTVIPLHQATAQGHNEKRKSTTKNEAEGVLGSPVQVRVEETRVRSTAFVGVDSRAKGKPRLAMLWEDNSQIPQLKIREMTYFPKSSDQASAELKTVAEYREELPMGVSHLIPVSQPTGGFLILDETHITYVDSKLEFSITRSLEKDTTIWATWERVDETRWLLADDYGRLYFIMINVEDGQVIDWRLDLLGHTSKAATLTYLDAGLVYVGSDSGDSQVVQIQEEGLKVIQSFDNLGPILDFAVMDLGRGTEGAILNNFSSGQGRIVTASGAWQDGSIRSVRSGVGMEVLGSLGEFPFVIDMWALKSIVDSEFEDTLVLAFVDETRIFRFDQEASIEEVDDFYGLEFSETTLLATNTPNHMLLQVSETKVQLADVDGGMTTATWMAPEGQKITGVSHSGECLVLVTGGVYLHVLNVSQEITSLNSKVFSPENEISSVALSSSLCLVGFWQSATVEIINLSSFETLHTKELGLDSVPRSLQIATLSENGPPTLFIALADGAVVTFLLDVEAKELRDMTRITLGSEPVAFKRLPLNPDLDSEASTVFASCEQPSIIYAAEGRTVYAAVDSGKSARVCSFNSQAFPGAVAVATSEELKLAMIDNKRTTQVQTLPCGETVLCISYCESRKLFGLGCAKRTLKNEVEEIVSSFKIADEVTFKELDSIPLKVEELIECSVLLPVARDGASPDPLFIVGTSLVEEPIGEVTGRDQRHDRGRILVYNVTQEKKLSVVTELVLRGACRCLATCDGIIIAGLSTSVTLYGLISKSTHSQDLELVKLASYRTATNPLSLCVIPSSPETKALVAVADLMKSVSILEFYKGDMTPDWYLEEVARHYASMWGSRVSSVGDKEWLASDMEGNLVVLRSNFDGVTQDDRKRLEVTSELKLGEVVSAIVPIRPLPPAKRLWEDNEKFVQKTTILQGPTPTPTSPQTTGPIVLPKVFLSTVEGGVYLVGTVISTHQDFLMRLQQAIAARVQGLGYMPWAKYRALKTEVQEAEEPFRFVDGELIEAFLALPAQDMEDAVREVGMGFDVEKVRTIVEELRLLH